MLRELLAQFFRFLVVARVVVAVRKTQPALIRFSNNFGAVLEILVGAEIKEHAHAFGLQARASVNQAGRVVNRFDGSQLRANRRQSLGINLLGVHAACVKITNLLLVRAASGGRVRRRRFQDTAQRLLISVRQSNEAAPQRIFRWNGIILQPAAHSELIKVVARLARAVEISHVKAIGSAFIRGHHAGTSGERHEERTKNCNGKNQRCRESARSHVLPLSLC